MAQASGGFVCAVSAAWKLTLLGCDVGRVGLELPRLPLLPLPRRKVARAVGLVGAGCAGRLGVGSSEHSDRVSDEFGVSRCVTRPTQPLLLVRGNIQGYP